MFRAARAPQVLTFDDLDRNDVALAGGKGASLGELCRAQVRVPPGFVVTTEAFLAVASGLLGEVASAVATLAGAGRDDVERVTAELRRQVMTLPLPEDLSSAIRDAYAQLGAHAGTDLPVAVRSSATGEDSAQDSFAGLQDTYLWVRGADDVLEHVRRCWASLYSIESVSYRIKRGLPEKGLAIAVVVQQMVDARCSGVVFTRSPRTGDRSVVAVEASWGLGSAVVSGEVTPDSWLVNKVTGDVIGRAVSGKLYRHVMDPSGRGVLAEDVPGPLRDTPSLTDEELRTVVAIGKTIERHYGCAQDIEWAWAGGDPAPFILQSRPETVWSNRSAPPAATPTTQPFDHVMALLGGGARPPAAGQPPP